MTRWQQEGILVGVFVLGIAVTVGFIWWAIEAGLRWLFEAESRP